MFYFRHGNGKIICSSSTRSEIDWLQSWLPSAHCVMNEWVLVLHWGRRGVRNRPELLWLPFKFFKIAWIDLSSQKMALTDM